MAALLMSVAQIPAFVTITQQPTNQLVSIGANVTNVVVATSTAPPLTYQWWFANASSNALLPGATNQILGLPNIQLAQAGGYYVKVSDADLTPVDSDAATIDVDPTYTQITTGPLVEDPAGGWNAISADYDGDGWVDVIVVPGGDRVTFPAVFHNEGGAIFRKVLTNVIAQTSVRAYAAVWGDSDNDGRLDLFMPNTLTMNDMLFHNNGNGSFTRITSGHPVSDGASSIVGIWGDYDQDGFLDLFVTTGTCDSAPQNDLLYRNNGDGSFAKMTAAQVGAIPADNDRNDGASWVDFDNDGRPELWRNVAMCTGHTSNQVLHLDSEGRFYLMDLGELTGRVEGYSAITWADYDNDGFLDAAMGNQTGWMGLYHNLAGQGFINVAGTAFPSPVPDTIGGFWMDYDNDGWQDLVVPTVPLGGDQGPMNLYRNNGNGTFSLVTLGGPTNSRWGLFWADYNNDGFLDMLVFNGPGRRNSLFLHNGNANHWLKVRLDGRASNRSGIGAKVRALATIAGRTFSQMREISGEGIGLDNGLIAHFGLGDATNVTALRIEWPSGIVQTLTNVAAGQMTNVVEHQEYGGPAPFFDTNQVAVVPAGFRVSITEPSAGAVYALEASTDLVNWTKLMARTSAGGTFNYTNAPTTSFPRRFYRVVVP